MSPEKIIDRIGGTSRVAEMCEVTKSAVSQWRRNGIPLGHMKFLRVVRPDAFDEVDSTESSAAKAVAS